MSADYLSALGSAPGPTAPPQPASLGMGQPPSLPGIPPPPTGKGPIPTGTSGSTKLTAAGDAIASLKNLTGFVPQLAAQITALIGAIKDATKKDVTNTGPAIGQAGNPGSAQLDGSPMLDSGSPGAM
jgi:hypothetical protein